MGLVPYIYIVWFGVLAVAPALAAITGALMSRAFISAYIGVSDRPHTAEELKS